MSDSTAADIIAQLATTRDADAAKRLRDGLARGESR